MKTTEKKEKRDTSSAIKDHVGNNADGKEKEKEKEKRSTDEQTTVANHKNQTPLPAKLAAESKKEKRNAPKSDDKNETETANDKNEAVAKHNKRSVSAPAATSSATPTASPLAKENNKERKSKRNTADEPRRSGLPQHDANKENRSRRELAVADAKDAGIPKASTMAPVPVAKVKMMRRDAPHQGVTNKSKDGDVNGSKKPVEKRSATTDVTTPASGKQPSDATSTSPALGLPK